MDLESIKKLEDVKKQLETVHQALSDRTNAAVKAASKDVVEQFSEHFTRSGFTIERSASGCAASYGTSKFTLQIDETARIGAFAVYTLTPPQTVSKQPTKVALVRKGGPTMTNIVYTTQPTPLQIAEKELQDAQAALDRPVTDFAFEVASQQRGQRGQGFSTFAEVLQKLYP